jgi:hypothetical protein
VISFFRESICSSLLDYWTELSSSTDLDASSRSRKRLGHLNEVPCPPLPMPWLIGVRCEPSDNIVKVIAVRDGFVSASGTMVVRVEIVRPVIAHTIIPLIKGQLL